MGVFAFVIVLFPAHTMAEEKSDKREAFVQTLGAEALKVLDDPELNEDKASKAVRKWLKDYFDTDTIARFALGRYWRQATDSEKKEYTGLFNDLIVETYAQRLTDYSGEQFKVFGHTEVNKRDTIVHSKIIPADEHGPSTQVDWRVRKDGSKHKIIDVIVEGVSMSVTQRSDFGSIIQKNGGSVESLLAKLRKKTKKG